MAALRPLVWFAAALLCAVASPARAAGPAVAVVEARAGGVAVTLACPDAAPRLAVAVDHTPAEALARERLGPAPPALALVVDRSAAMGAPGTPESSRMADALQLARLLLALAPAESPATVVVADGAARVALPLTVDRAAALAALAALDLTPGATGSPPLALGAALELAAGQLRSAPPGPRAVLILAAEGQSVGQQVAQVAPEARTLVVGLGAGAGDGAASPLAGAAAGLGASYMPYHADAIEALPALHRAAAGRLRVLIQPGERLRLTLSPVGPGAHLLTMEGCGAPLAVAFEGPTRPLPGLAAMGGLVAASLGAALLRARARRLAATRAAPAPVGAEARRLAPDATPTARRAGGPVGPAGLRAVLWDGERRRVVALEGRHWTVGSDPGCAIVAAGEGVVPLHARLSAAGDGLTITGLASAGDTRLGALGRLLAPGAPAPLAEGELVLLGQSTRLMVERAYAGPEEAL